MLGSRRCAPSAERQRQRCSVYQLSPLRILEELATECAASQLRGRAASRTPLKAFVELHNRGSYTAALEVAERSLRPAGWRVVTAVLLREPVAQLASWFLFDGLRSDRCGVTPKNKRGRACTAVEYVERAARAPGGLQAFLIAGGNKTEPPAAVPRAPPRYSRARRSSAPPSGCPHSSARCVRCSTSAAPARPTALPSVRRRRRWPIRRTRACAAAFSTSSNRAGRTATPRWRPPSRPTSPSTSLCTSALPDGLWGLVSTVPPRARCGSGSGGSG